MAQRHKTPEQANVINSIPNQLARYRVPREGWPYPRPTATESFQSHQVQHPVEQVQIHQSQYVPYNQFPEQQGIEVFYQNQNPNHYQNPRLPIQQQVMYNNIYS